MRNEAFELSLETANGHETVGSLNVVFVDFMPRIHVQNERVGVSRDAFLITHKFFFQCHG